MYKILKAETLAAKIHLMVVHAPRVASHCQPGQFIIVKLDEKGERIPLTICDYDREEGTVTIVFQEIGVSTIKMAELKAGDAFRDFVGPLGCPSEFVHEDIEELKKKKMVFVDVYTSWCGPCRREIPNIKKIYAEFKDKGLQVVGVSIDSSDKAWKKALEEENMDYLQLYDPEGITSKLYNYNGIPFIILISPEGIILEKGLRGEKITEYLK